MFYYPVLLYPSVFFFLSWLYNHIDEMYTKGLIYRLSQQIMLPLSRCRYMPSLFASIASSYM